MPYPLLLGAFLLLLDLLLWRAIPVERRNWRTAARVVAFLLFTGVLLSAGISPLQPPPWPEDLARNLIATVLEITWWLFAARTLTVVIGLLLIARSGHTGRLLQDVLGAVIFLVAIVAAAAYVMQLPVKGLLATSGVMAIVIGLALQSTLSDVFSGIVLNTTRPYQIDEWISIDGTEGKVLDALEKTLQGSSALLSTPAPKATIKTSTLESVEYEASGFVGSMGEKTSVRNQMFDLAHRHLVAAGVIWNPESDARPWSRQRGLLEDVRIFRALTSEEKDSLSQRMIAVEYPADQIILGVDEASDHVLVIGTGVVSASVRDGERLLEAGRMGPGEVLGLEGLLDSEASIAEFRSLTSCLLYRIDKAEVRSCLEQRDEVKTALSKLQRFRQDNSQSLLLQRPAEVKKGGFLHWLQRKA